MKRLISVAVLAAFLAATNIGCGDSKPAAKAPDAPKGGSDKPAGSGDRPSGRDAPKG